MSESNPTPTTRPVWKRFQLSGLIASVDKARGTAKLANRNGQIIECRLSRALAHDLSLNISRPIIAIVKRPATVRLGVPRIYTLECIEPMPLEDIDWHVGQWFRARYRGKPLRPRQAPPG